MYKFVPSFLPRAIAVPLLLALSVESKSFAYISIYLRYTVDSSGVWNHRNIEYPKLERGNDDRVQPVTPYRANEKLSSVSKSIVQTLLERGQAWGHNHLLGEQSEV